MLLAMTEREAFFNSLFKEEKMLDITADPDPSLRRKI
jgi:hypothetical protein